MPLLKLETTVAIPDAKLKSLLAALSKTIVAVTGKPEQFVMVTCTQAAIQMSGKDGVAAFVDIRGIGGWTAEMTATLSQRICQLLRDSLAIPTDRIYLNFTDVNAANWGWNGETFA
jgi:phenylpyruvate tautomerase